ncbi:hypothetical protein CMV_004684 [Castanea mollissima]|uniref:Uncharacterized protein n=1 Tax=Castanea mollissima TaxID=60419 RepID=A0A8J4RF00_9ROSI|nr:hypothetical protein CMV_004684 [Castanea mollissima]
MEVEATTQISDDGGWQRWRRSALMEVDSDELGDVEMLTTFRRDFEITKEEQGLHTTLQILPYLRYTVLIHVRRFVFIAG